jgi:protein SCO1/2
MSGFRIEADRKPGGLSLQRAGRSAYILAVIAAAGCGQSGSESSRRGGDRPLPANAPRAQTTTGPSEEDERTFTLRGEVARVDRERGIVAIRHEEIAGYMPAMTMPFDLTGDPILDELQVGDQVEGKLVVTAKTSALKDMIITELAEPGADGEGEGKTPSGPKAIEPGEVVPDFTMTTQEGARLALSDLRGEVVVLTFIYTRCPLPDYCPLMDRKFAELERRVALLGAAGERIRLLSVSFDPEHDTPEVLARHAKAVGAKPPRWTFAVAAHDELRKVAGALGLTYGATGNEIIHTLSTAVIGPDGKLARLERGNSWGVDELFSAVRALAKDLDRPS